MSLPVSIDDLGTYLGATVDYARGQQILDLAHTLCEAIINPLPAGAEAVVLDVAARAYSNPTNVSQESTGPFSVQRGPVSGGLWLTRANKSTLRQLAGQSGGAFTIDTMPANAGQGLPWWDTGIVPPNEGGFSSWF